MKLDLPPRTLSRWSRIRRHIWEEAYDFGPFQPKLRSEIDRLSAHYQAKHPMCVNFVIRRDHTSRTVITHQLEEMKSNSCHCCRRATDQMVRPQHCACDWRPWNDEHESGISSIRRWYRIACDASARRVFDVLVWDEHSSAWLSYAWIYTLRVFKKTASTPLQEG